MAVLIHRDALTGLVATDHLARRALTQTPTSGWE